MSLLIFFQNHQVNPLAGAISVNASIRGHIIAAAGTTSNNADGVNGAINVTVSAFYGGFNSETVPPITDPALRYAQPSSVGVHIGAFHRPGVLGSLFTNVQLISRELYP